MCIQRRRLYENQLIITRIWVRRFCRFCSRMCTTFYFSCHVQFSFLHRQYTILNAIKKCYFRNRKLKKNFKKWHLQLTIRYYSSIFSKFVLIYNILKKKHQLVSLERDRPFPLKFWTKNRFFSPATVVDFEK